MIARGQTDRTPSPSSLLLDEIDPMAPQREAALFYGLFLRGHSADSLRRDIDVPRKLLDKLLKRHRNELGVQVRLQRAYQYRKQVLAIFDELVIRERIKERVHLTSSCKPSCFRINFARESGTSVCRGTGAERFVAGLK